MLDLAKRFANAALYRGILLFLLFVLLYLTKSDPSTKIPLVYYFLIFACSVWIIAGITLIRKIKNSHFESHMKIPASLHHDAVIEGLFNLFIFIMAFLTTKNGDSIASYFIIPFLLLNLGWMIYKWRMMYKTLS